MNRLPLGAISAASGSIGERAADVERLILSLASRDQGGHFGVRVFRGGG